jgi:hypothetical protein
MCKMDEQQSRLLAKLKQSYSDRRNTITWALFLWTFTAVGFSLFMPVWPTMVRSIAVAIGWSAVHLMRRV